MKEFDHSRKPSLQDTPKVLKECPLCSSKYLKKHMNILEEDDGAQLVHVTCASCHHAMLALVVISHIGMSSIGMLTDLTETDVVRVYDQEPIDDTDVLLFHEMLTLHQNEFIHLLNSQIV